MKKANPKSAQAMTPQAFELIARSFRVLGVPLRLRILELLQSGQLSVNGIADSLRCSQPNISKHLKILQEIGWLTRHCVGNTVFYAIADQVVFQLCEVMCGHVKKRLMAESEVFGRKR
jgi:DNA-binding transcriptional ArsR family regulator